MLNPPCGNLKCILTLINITAEKKERTDVGLICSQTTLKFICLNVLCTLRVFKISCVKDISGRCSPAELQADLHSGVHLLLLSSRRDKT